MKSQQQLKADARKSAQSAPKIDPEIAKAAKAEAEAEALQSGSPAHGDKAEPISEFDDPAANIVRR